LQIYDIFFKPQKDSPESVRGCLLNRLEDKVNKLFCHSSMNS